jgi:hypothetical protein
MPNRLVSEIPAGPPGVFQIETGEMVRMKRLSRADPRLAG